jgi:hypothetical protein
MPRNVNKLSPSSSVPTPFWKLNYAYYNGYEIMNDCAYLLVHDFIAIDDS